MPAQITSLQFGRNDDARRALEALAKDQRQDKFIGLVQKIGVDELLTLLETIVGSLRARSLDGVAFDDDDNNVQIPVNDILDALTNEAAHLLEPILKRRGATTAPPRSLAGGASSITENQACRP